ncbi:hypothetical protein DFJ68_1930 [Terracoccus luteus]|uniref:Uncharacterized protein n=1 Tax=Terracoccus luteus TaxID=53356 RepID=A0A495Y029_9MICO|nr:hypothetical protein DFJ68_1930 [Terracoccus luteus]
MLFTLAPSRTKHVTMTSLMSKPSVGWPYRLFRRGITHIITWSSVQQQVAVGLGYGRGRVSYVPHPVDCRFYTPGDCCTDR